MKHFILALAALTTSCASLQSGDRQIASQQIELAQDFENSLLQLAEYDPGAPEKKCAHVAGIALAPPAKKIVLTFDDGPSARNTPQVLALLKKYNIKATFFMQGNHAEKNMAIVQQVASEGHLIGNHSYSHGKAFPLTSEQTQDEEISRNAIILQPFMDQQSVKLFRFPYGSSTCHAINYVVNTTKYDGSLGWHVDTCDWAFQATGTVTSKIGLRDCGIKPENVSSYHAHVMDQVRRRNGGVVLMHETNDRTVATLKDIIETLISEGYTFTNMDDPQMRPYIKGLVAP